MTRLFNDPADFASEALDGFVRAHSRWVHLGGIVRAASGAPGNVAVVVDGGSGHYPAFSGLVVPGMANGATIGNVFLGRFAHDPHALATALAEADGLTQQAQEVLR